MASVSEEERQRRSELAKQLNSTPHPDDPNRRKFGGPQPGSGRPKTKRASTMVAEKAAQHADEIVKAFRRGVNSQDERTAVMAAERWVNLEQKEASIQMEEEKHIEDLDRGELVRMLAEGFAKLQSAGVHVMELPMADAVVVDGSVEEDGPNPFLEES
jgi:hypothetical protein